MVTGKGRYLYGVAASGKAARLGLTGIEGSDIHTIPYEGLCAIVHDCPAQPYQSADEETVKSWVKTHQNVLDEAKKQLGSIIPMGFDAILKSGDDAISPDQVVKDWLKQDYGRLQALMEKIRDKDEYGVQICYKAVLMGEQVSEQSQKIRRIREEMTMKPPGTAYLYKQKLEKTIRAEIETLAGEWFRDFYGRIKRHCYDIVVEKTRKADRDKVMLLNLSCLVDREKVDSLGEELEKINNTEGFSVHFSGPWPPYTFVAKPRIAASNVKEASGVK